MLQFSRDLMVTILFSCTFLFAARVTAEPLCSAPSSDSAVITSTIDYNALNQLLTTPNTDSRIQQIPGWIKRIKESSDPEATALLGKLYLALARAQAATHQIDKALATLKKFPLDSVDAPKAVLFTATLEELKGNTQKALYWYALTAELFPDDVIHAEALSSQAKLENNPEKRIAILKKLISSSERNLEEARHWNAQSQSPDFLENIQTQSPDESLWRHTSSALTNREFESAEKHNEDTWRYLQCLQSEEMKRQDIYGNVAELSQYSENLIVVIDNALKALTLKIEDQEKSLHFYNDFLKACKKNHQTCEAEKLKRDTSGRLVTQWHNQLATLEAKKVYLVREYQTIPKRWQQERETALRLAIRLAQQNTESRSTIRTLLRNAINQSMHHWEELTAEAYFALASEQEALLTYKQYLRSN